MQSDFLTRIKNTYNQFGAAEARVADRVLLDPQRVVFMSISELADSCKVSDSTVFRFCQKLGVGGYQEFKTLLSLGIREDKDTAGEGEAEKYNENATPFMRRAAGILETDVEALRETCAAVREEDIKEVVGLLHEARRIAFFGAGVSLLSAMQAANRFTRITDKVSCVQDTHLQAIQAALLQPGDVAVIFSYSGASKDTVQTAQIAKKAGARLICISRFSKSPLSGYADMLLISGGNEGPLQGGSASAVMCQLFLADVLYEEYYRRYYEECRANHEKTSAVIADKLY